MSSDRKMFASTGIVLFLTTASFAQQVKTDYDREANFNRYKTYYWEKVQTQDALRVDRIKEAVETALAAKGGGWRWRGFGGFGDSTTTVENYKGGTLVVDLFDANTNKSGKNIRNLDKGVSSGRKKIVLHIKKGVSE